MVRAAGHCLTPAIIGYFSLFLSIFCISSLPHMYLYFLSPSFSISHPSIVFPVIIYWKILKLIKQNATYIFHARIVEIDAKSQKNKNTGLFIEIEIIAFFKDI